MRAGIRPGLSRGAQEFGVWGIGLLGLGLLVGCSCGSNGGSGAPADGGGDGAVVGDGGVASDSGRDAGGDPCGSRVCGPGERCENMAGVPTCVPNTCADLMCEVTERCAPAPVGEGFVCEDNRCTDDIECGVDEYCNGTICVGDDCVPGAQQCDGNQVSECLPNGSDTFVRVSCAGDAYFTSMCEETADGATCSCQDDWDCPAFTTCEVDRCEGTGRQPTCFLPPSPFMDVLPAPEPGFPWGGTFANRNATGSPFPASSQVVVTPLVVNLDDDTGDGLIDERDFPEIVFTTFCNSEFTTNGVLRAVHGGGPNRGADYFASCGGTVWHEGDDPSAVTCTCGSAVLDSTAGLAAGDLDGDGVPEIVAISESDGLRLFDNTGEEIAALTASGLGGQNPSPSIVNVDGVGFAEIVIGRNVFTLEHDAMGALTFVDRFQGTGRHGIQRQGPISCVADVDADGRQEIVGGGTVYRFPQGPAGVTRQSDCTGSETDADEVAYCNGTLPILWNADVEGFCAIADIWGADDVALPGPANPLDGTPEVILIADGRLRIYRAADGTELLDRALGAGGRGGAPNVDDFDGDGFPEVGTAFSTRYSLIDLQPATAMCPDWLNVYQDGVAGLQGNSARTPPSAACTSDADCGDPAQFACNEATSTCVCLHNGWLRQTEDGSSRVTGSSVFDFNGDGAAEVVYNDECYFRVYEGLDGTVLFREPSESRTRTENPVVADVDNDGNAEIVFATSNESRFCSDRSMETEFNNGLEVWGDPMDLWVSARRIWNQHPYHVTNVFEGGGVPTREPESWRPYAGRQYNTYRSQPRSPFGIAPDLVIERIQITSPDTACGSLSDTIEITVRVVNQGDLRVGPDVLVGFYGEWTAVPLSETLFADGGMTPLTTTLGTPLEPGGEQLLTVRYAAANNSPGVLPDEIRVVVDEAMAERECREDNNERTTPVEPGDPEADLVVELGMVGGDCPEKTFETTVRNQGSAVATDVVVRYYAGDPAAGGEALHDEMLTGSLAPGAEVTFTAVIDPFPDRSVQVYAVVDPDDTVVECNDGNNTDALDDRIDCFIVF